MSNTKRGFTLIELLVVIAIIGILSAVVLASLNTARSKGSDAAVQSDMKTVQTQAAIYQNDNNGSYNTSGVAISASTLAGCTASGVFSDATIVKALTNVNTDNAAGGIVCGSDAKGTAYMAAAKLVSSADYFCVDSTGAATTTATTITAGATTCP